MTSDTYIAIGAFVVSLVAVGVSLWSGLADRRHMKLSVRPVAAITVADFENRLAVWISNKGLGPMRIKSLTVTDASETVHSDLMSFMPELSPNVEWTNFHGNADRVFVEAGKRLELLLLEGDRENQAFCVARDSIRRTLATLTVCVEYEDLYGQSMPSEKRPLSWFGRHDQ